jgi:hypothetical protein
MLTFPTNIYCLKVYYRHNRSNVTFSVKKVLSLLNKISSLEPEQGSFRVCDLRPCNPHAKTNNFFCPTVFPPSCTISELLLQ